MKTNVYVDGFNLYYDCLKATPYRCLDLDKLCRTLLPKNTISRIRYFTAQVQARPSDLTQPDRQNAYIRALKTIPNLSVHLGHFLTSVIRMPLAQPLPGDPKTVEVIKTEEKGSDVNLASFLLMDGFVQEYDVAVVVSNDSDLALPIRVVREVLKREVIVLNPCRVQSVTLTKAATFVKPIRSGALQACQFPPTLSDAVGTITKPAAW